MQRLVFVGVLSFSACATCDGPGEPARDAGVLPTASASVPAVVPSVSSSVGPWGEAAAGDEMAAMRLAEQHTAPELAAIARGGPQAQAALAALAHSDDAELALAELSAIAADVRRGDLAVDALRAIGAIAARPARNTEPLDPDGLRACIRVLDQMSRSSAQARGRRVLAVNALRGFARAGFLKIEDVTSELD